METHTRWAWKSKAHPSGKHGFLFSDFTNESEARKLIRVYWDLDRLPTGFKLFYDESTCYDIRQDDIQIIDGKSIIPIKVKA